LNLSNNQKYTAKITPVPTITSSGVLWGWKAEFTDLSDEKMYPFEGSSAAGTAEQALKDGVRALRAYTKALDEVSIYSVDLYAPDKEDEVSDETPAEADKEEAAPEEKLEEKVDDAPAEPEKNEKGETV
jgi:hypothetical protein